MNFSPSSGKTGPGKLFAVVLAAITLVGPLSVHLFLPAMPEVKAVFQVSDAVARVTFSITLATMAFMTLVYGALSDRYGRRPVLLAGLSLFIVGSALAAVAPSVTMLVLARMIQAAGAGCGVALARAIARDAYGPDYLVRAIAYLTMAYTLGPLLAPLVGGLLTDILGWRSLFWFAVAFGGTIALAAAMVLFETHEARPQEAATPRKIIADFVKLFGRVRFVAFVAQTGFSSGTFFTLAAGASFLMQESLGRSASDFGLYFLLFPTGYFLGNFISSRVSGRTTVEFMVISGSVLLAATAAIQGVLLVTGYLTPLTLFVPGFILSLAQGIALPSAQAGAIRVIPHLSGTAAGIGAFMQMICAAAFSQLAGLFSDGTPMPMVIIMSVCAALTLAAGLAAYTTRRTGGPVA